MSSPFIETTAILICFQSSHRNPSTSVEQRPQPAPDNVPNPSYQGLESNMGTSTSSLGGQSIPSPSFKDAQPSPPSSITKIRPLPPQPPDSTMQTFLSNDSGPHVQQATSQSPRKSASVRSNNSQISPGRRMPLIFAAMATVEHEAEERSMQPQITPPRHAEPWDNSPSPPHSYPSPPMEYGSSRSRSISVPPQHLNQSAQFGASLSTMMENTMTTPPPSSSMASPVADSRPARPGVAEQPAHLNQSIVPPATPATPQQPSASSVSTPPRSPQMEGIVPQLSQPYDQPQTPPRAQRSGKHGTHVHSPPDGSSANSHAIGHVIPLGSTDAHTNARGNHRTLTKARPTTPVSPGTPVRKLGRSVELDSDIVQNVGIPLDDDPFAKVEGVKMLKPTSRDGTSPSKDGISKRSRTRDGTGKAPPSRDDPGEEAKSPARLELNGHHSGTHEALSRKVNAPPPPAPPNDSRNAIPRHRGEQLESSPPLVADVMVQQDQPPVPFTLTLYLSDPHLLSSLLGYLAFYDWCILSSVSKQIRMSLNQNDELREEVLERFLRTVGYVRWARNDSDPLSLSLKVSLSASITLGTLTVPLIIPGPQRLHAGGLYADT